jgi:hypothetical protein
VYEHLKKGKQSAFRDIVYGISKRDIPSYVWYQNRDIVALVKERVVTRVVHANSESSSKLVAARKLAKKELKALGFSTA